MDQWMTLLLIALALVATVFLIIRYFRRSSDVRVTKSDADVTTDTSTSYRTPFERMRARLKKIADRYPPPPAASEQVPRSFWQRHGSRLGWALLLILLFLGAIWFLPNNAVTAQARAIYHRLFSTDRFVVVVAPFNDGAGGQTGYSVATELGERLRSGPSDMDMIVEVVPNAPSSAEDISKIAERYGADVVIWGNVQSGGVPNDTTLNPQIFYRPTGEYGPLAWDGYAGRFALPENYALSQSNAPINGNVVLPRVIQVLAMYHMGYADNAYEHMAPLLYDRLNLIDPTLLYVLRGNTMWARGIYDQAVAEYNLALVQTSDDDDRALLSNNLGAILLDAGDTTAATGILARAESLERAEYWYNLGILSMQQGDIDGAIEQLERARTRLPTNTALRVELATLYRDHARLADAETVLTEAERQARAELRQIPGVLQDAATADQQTRLLEARALLTMAQSVDARGPLAWELEMTPIRSEEDIDSALDNLREAVDLGNQAVTAWNSHATAEAALLQVINHASEPSTGIVGNRQARRARSVLDRTNYSLALALIEDQRLTLSQSPDLVRFPFTLLGTNTSALQEAEALINRLLQTAPNDPDILTIYARASWLHFNFDQTRERYKTLLVRAPNSPEGYYGMGFVDMHMRDDPSALHWMYLALERNERHFPARIRIIDMAAARGTWDEAITHSRILAEQYPGTRSDVRLAAVLRGSGNHTEARQILEQSDQQSSLVQIESARLYRETGQPDNALAAYRRALAIDDRSVNAWLELGTLLAEQGQADAAAQEFRNAIFWDSENIPARLALADLYLESLNNPAGAVEQYEYVVEYESNHPGTIPAETLMKVGDVLMVHGDPATAATAYHFGIMQQPTNATLHHHLGNAYIALDNLDGARVHQQRALELVPGDDVWLRTSILIQLGEAQRLQGDTSGAIASYNQAIELNPERANAHLGLGMIAFHQQQWTMAQGHFERASQMPDGRTNPLTYFWLAESLLRQGKAHPASEVYQQAMDVQGEPSEAIPYPDSLLGLSQAQQMMGQNNEAEQTIQQALTLRPTFAEAWLFRGILLQNRGALQEAMVAYSAAIEHNPQLFEPYYRRGLMYIQQQRHGDAIADLNMATRVNPNHAEAFYWKGRAYLAQDNLQAAQTAFNQAVQLSNGTHAEAQFYQNLVEEELNNRTASR